MFWVIETSDTVQWDPSDRKWEVFGADLGRESIKWLLSKADSWDWSPHCGWNKRRAKSI